MSTEIGVVTSKGQLVIPVKFRRKLGIKKGTTVAFLEERGAARGSALDRPIHKSDAWLPESARREATGVQSAARSFI